MATKYELEFTNEEAKLLKAKAKDLGYYSIQDLIRCEVLNREPLISAHMMSIVVSNIYLRPTGEEFKMEDLLPKTYSDTNDSFKAILCGRLRDSLLNLKGPALEEISRGDELFYRRI